MRRPRFGKSMSELAGESVERKSSDAAKLAAFDGMLLIVTAVSKMEIDSLNDIRAVRDAAKIIIAAYERSKTK